MKITMNKQEAQEAIERDTRALFGLSDQLYVKVSIDYSDLINIEITKENKDAKQNNTEEININGDEKPIDLSEVPF